MEIRQAFVRKVYTILCKFCAAVPALKCLQCPLTSSLPNPRNLHLRRRFVAFRRGYYLDQRAVSTLTNFLDPFPHPHFTARGHSTFRSSELWLISASCTGSGTVTLGT